MIEQEDILQLTSNYLKQFLHIITCKYVRMFEDFIRMGVDTVMTARDFVECFFN